MWFDFYYALCLVICCSLLFHILVLLHFVSIWIGNVILCDRNVMLNLYCIVVPLTNWYYHITLLFLTNYHYYDYRVMVMYISKSILLCVYLWFTSKHDCFSFGIVVPSWPQLLFRHNCDSYYCIELQIIVPFQYKSVVCNIWSGLLCISIWFKFLFNISFHLVWCPVLVYCLNYFRSEDCCLISVDYDYCFIGQSFAAQTC